MTNIIKRPFTALYPAPVILVTCGLKRRVIDACGHYRWRSVG